MTRMTSLMSPLPCGRLLPADIVLSRDEELHPYECDGLSVFRQKPMLVVLPRTEEEVRQVLVTCRRLEVPVVARGAGTGLSGGAMPHAVGRTPVARPP